MGKFTLQNSFQIKEGHYLLKIQNVTQNEVNQRVTVTYATKDNQKINEIYSLLDKDGNENEVAIRMLSFLVQIAMQDYNITEIDLEELIGRYIEADLTNQEYEAKDGTKKTAVRLNKKTKTNETFEDIADAEVDYDLNDILS